MSEHTPFDAASDAYFQAQFQLSLEALLAPVDSSQPAGRSLRGGSIYSAIAQARRQDDASLPMGGWEHELKRADWRAAGKLCAAALCTESKDLQLAAWLLEAQISQTGLAGIGPCFYLMHRLCQSYWDTLYPRAAQDELEHRANIFQWINEKLLPAIRMVPLTMADRPRQFDWADWEMARRQEKIKATAPAGRGVPAASQGAEEPSCSMISAAISASPTTFYLAQRDALAMALAALDTLTHGVDALFGAEAPGMHAIEGMLRQILSLVEGELHKRGVSAPAAAPQADGGADFSLVEGALAAGLASAGAAPAGAIKDRAEAYARLAETAEYLMRLEPHSPVPYLVRRATEWGGLNTVELYQELFLKLNGQLNIFEMLGLQAQAELG